METNEMTELDEARAAVLDRMADSASICNGCDACRDARELLAAFERAVVRAIPCEYAGNGEQEWECINAPATTPAAFEVYACNRCQRLRELEAEA